MSVERISDARDSRVADYRGVTDADLVRARGLFVAEGRLVVRRVIEDGRFHVRSLLVNEAVARDLDQLTAGSSSVPVFVGAAAILQAIAGYDVHRGCLALVERPPARGVADVIGGARTLMILEGVANPDNVGGVFRNAAAFGAGGVLLSPTCADPLYRKAIRTSMGAVLRVPYATADPWPDVLTTVRAAGFTIVALTPRAPSESLDAFAARTPPPRVALVLGTEGDGLTAAVEAAADCRVRIPISADVDSLNLSVAAGIALHALVRM